MDMGQGGDAPMDMGQPLRQPPKHTLSIEARATPLPRPTPPATGPAAARLAPPSYLSPSGSLSHGPGLPGRGPGRRAGPAPARPSRASRACPPAPPASARTRPSERRAPPASASTHHRLVTRRTRSTRPVGQRLQLLHAQERGTRRKRYTEVHAERGTLELAFNTLARVRQRHQLVRRQRGWLRALVPHGLPWGTWDQGRGATCHGTSAGRKERSRGAVTRGGHEGRSRGAVTRGGHEGRSRGAVTRGGHEGRSRGAGHEPA
jgi:hypothetical protein